MSKIFVKTYNSIKDSPSEESPRDRSHSTNEESIHFFKKKWFKIASGILVGNCGVAGFYLYKSPVHARDAVGEIITSATHDGDGNWCMITGPDWGGGAGYDIGDGGARYCGGHGSDGTQDLNPIDQISCTPFNFQPHTGDGYGGCFDDFDDAKQYTGGRYSAKAWRLHSYDDNKTPLGRYVVFHGCDGAGIQASDCNGDTYYFEMFSEYSNAGDGFPYCELFCNTWPDCMHNICGFTHHGTGKTYQSYDCGWWNVGAIEQDKFFNDYRATGNYAPGSNPAYANVYPWVCHYQSGTPGDYPDRNSIFTGNEHLQCYCDNEPMDYSGSYNMPPDTQLYTFDMDSSGEWMTMYYLNPQDDSGNSFKQFFLYPEDEPW